MKCVLGGGSVWLRRTHRLEQVPPRRMNPIVAQSGGREHDRPGDGLWLGGGQDVTGRDDFHESLPVQDDETERRIGRRIQAGRLPDRPVERRVMKKRRDDDPATGVTAEVSPIGLAVERDRVRVRS